MGGSLIGAAVYDYLVVLVLVVVGRGFFNYGVVWENHVVGLFTYRT